MPSSLYINPPFFIILKPLDSKNPVAQLNAQHTNTAQQYAKIQICKIPFNWSLNSQLINNNPTPLYIVTTRSLRISYVHCINKP